MNEGLIPHLFLFRNLFIELVFVFGAFSLTPMFSSPLERAKSITNSSHVGSVSASQQQIHLTDQVDDFFHKQNNALPAFACRRKREIQANQPNYLRRFKRVKKKQTQNVWP